MTSTENNPDQEHQNETGDEEIEVVLEDEIKISDPEDTAKNELDDFKDKYLRVLAEFDNFRKRTSKEKAGMYDDGVVDTITRLLPVIDNLDRALESATNDDDPLYKGVDMIRKQLDKIFDEIGVKAIDATGHPFDPNQHAAVAHVQDDNYSENTVTEELQKGYKYKEKILRYSMVKVAN